MSSEEKAKYSETWLIQNSVIRNVAIIRILVELTSQGGKIHVDLTG
jgi:hypothetical protein